MYVKLISSENNRMEFFFFFLLFCNLKKLFTTDEYKMLNRRGRGSRQKSLYSTNRISRMSNFTSSPSGKT